jgi:hypothetical protein
VPISNVLTGSKFTLSIAVGAKPQLLNVMLDTGSSMLDTGSSMLVVDGAIYDPGGDTGVATTQLLQTAQFQSGSFMAAVVRAPVGLVSGPGAPAAVPN